jgi:putative ATP-dependent endonuclease of the OLD family
MYVKRISITNYRNFGSQLFTLPLKPFTLLVGENNIGKTNLLSAMALLFSQEISIKQQRVLDLDDINYATLAAFKKNVVDEGVDAAQIVFPEITVTALLSDFEADQEAVVGDWFTDSALDTAEVTYRFALRTSFNRVKWITEQRNMLQEIAAHSLHDDIVKSASNIIAMPLDLWKHVDFPIGDYRYSIYGGGDPSNECEANHLGMIRAEILDALRDAGEELMAGGEQRLLYRVLRSGADSKYADLKERLAELETCIRSNPNLQGLKSAVESLLNRVSLKTGPQDNAIDFQFSSPDAGEILKKVGMVYGDTPINVARNGLGRNNLLYLSLVLSQLAKASSPTDDAYACFRFVGVEEPEAHLHPHLQDHLARNIEIIRNEHDKSMQLLLTSHSTHIAAKLNLKNTAVLFQENPGGPLKTHYILDGIDEVRDADAIRFLSLYLDATKSRMFFARRLILVEGITEAVIIPRLFEIHTQGRRTLESIGTTVINVGGVAFRHFLAIVKNGYFRRCAVLTDQDTTTQMNERASDLKAKFDTPNLIDVQITNEATFEKDLISCNKSGEGKQILLQALKETKPTNGKRIAQAHAVSDLDTTEFFSEIKDYKAEFAFNLACALNKPDCGFVIPPYIVSAFNFLG